VLARIMPLLVKELLQLRRDRYAIIHLVVLALAQLLMFGYAATFEVHRVSTVLLDRDQSHESRELLSRFTASGRFEVTAVARDAMEVAGP
jgi:ABC-2 type transport system permease protein